MKKLVNHLTNCQEKAHLDKHQPLNNSTTQLNKSDYSQQHPPKFSIGDEVVWAYVKAHDHGVVVNRLWVDETVHKVTGWHYLIRLHSNSSSYPFCKEDWAYEEDLKLLSRQQQDESLE